MKNTLDQHCDEWFIWH